MNDFMPQDYPENQPSHTPAHPAIPDPRVAKLLDEMQLVYSVNPNTADYQINYRCFDGKSQQVLIETNTEELDGCEIRTISACGFEKVGGLDLPLANFLLRSNQQLIFGSWFTLNTSNHNVLAIFKVPVGTTLSTKMFASMLDLVAHVASSAPMEFEEFKKREC
jgi:hypothetical protein